MTGRNLCLLVMLAGMGLGSCATAGDLARQPAAGLKNLPGTFTLVMVGGTFAADAERIAILDLDGDDYSFRPVTPPDRVKRMRGLAAAAAEAEAEKFFAGHCAYNGYVVKSLVLAGGVTVGYELVPDYPPSLCEDGNEVTVSYSVKEEGKIQVYTWLRLPVTGAGFGGRAFSPRERD